MTSPFMLISIYKDLEELITDCGIVGAHLIAQELKPKAQNCSRELLLSLSTSSVP